MGIIANIVFQNRGQGSLKSKEVARSQLMRLPRRTIKMASVRKEVISIHIKTRSMEIDRICLSIRILRYRMFFVRRSLSRELANITQSLSMKESGRCSLKSSFIADKDRTSSILE